MARFEENHFLRGDRRLSEADVQMAKHSGPILVLIAKRQKVTTFKDFVAIAKKNFPNSVFVKQTIPVLMGRRFEAFRLYLRAYHLPDPSSWITDQHETNSAEYIADFDPLAQRDASAKQDWSKYIPWRKSLLGVERYTNFFASLEYFAKTHNSKKPGDALQTHLAKLHIRSVFSEHMKILSENNLKKLVKDEKKSRDSWVERVRQGEHFNDIVQEILIRP